MEGDHTTLQEPITSRTVDPISDINLKFPSEEERRANSILRCIKNDLKAADLKWSLFVCACESYKVDACVRPFPPLFLKDGVKDISTLQETLSHIPAFPVLEHYLSDTETCHIDKSAIDLLYWGLVQMNQPFLESVPSHEIDDVLNLISSDLNAQRPNYIFEVKYGHMTPADNKWKALKEGYNSLFAYHGSRLENFHSILNFGLQQHLNKNGLFGQGIYLSSELVVSLPYSQNGFGWGKSILGSELSIVALCEMIDHPTINCQSKGDKSRAVAQDSCVGEIPHKFYLVSNSDLVRIRYLLVYSRTPPFPYNTLQQENTLIGWFKEHKLATIMLGYCVMLASLGLSKNQFIQRIYRMLCQKIGLHFFS